jgi:5-methyltetrahydrofolate--homocysteine methyltransferase
MSERLERFKQRLAAGEMLLADGAWSTEMQKHGLQIGDCPEEWNVTQPEKVRQIARAYLEAGSDFCLTNTFCANRYRLLRRELPDRVREFNVAGARLSREVADTYGRLVAASVGPTGEYVEPEGLLRKDEMYAAFREQIVALKEGGADAVWIETMSALDEAVLAVKAARDAGLYCMASMSFDATPEAYQTVLGATVEEATRALDAAGADVIGTNCGNGMPEMIALARIMRAHTAKPLLVKANAGLPEIVGGKRLYRQTPETMAALIPELRAAGVSIVGGCCGTTPAHIRAFRTVIDRINKKA